MPFYMQTNNGWEQVGDLGDATNQLTVSDTTNPFYFGGNHDFTIDFNLETIIGKNNVRVKKVIFNHPATIVFFEDGTKVVVKTKFGEVFDYEKGLAMAICKKALGDAYRSTFKKWVPETKKDFHYDHGNAKPIRNTKEFSSILKQLLQYDREHCQYPLTSDMEDDD